MDTDKKHSFSATSVGSEDEGYSLVENPDLPRITDQDVKGLDSDCAALESLQRGNEADTEAAGACESVHSELPCRIGSVIHEYVDAEMPLHSDEQGAGPNLVPGPNLVLSKPVCTSPAPQGRSSEARATLLATRKTTWILEGICATVVCCLCLALIFSPLIVYGMVVSYSLPDPSLFPATQPQLKRLSHLIPTNPYNGNQALYLELEYQQLFLEQQSTLYELQHMVQSLEDELMRRVPNTLPAPSSPSSSSSGFVDEVYLKLFRHTHVLQAVRETVAAAVQEAQQTGLGADVAPCSQEAEWLACEMSVQQTEARLHDLELQLKDKQAQVVSLHHRVGYLEGELMTTQEMLRRLTSESPTEQPSERGYSDSLMDVAQTCGADDHDLVSAQQADHDDDDLGAVEEIQTHIAVQPPAPLEQSGIVEHVAAALATHASAASTAANHHSAGASNAYTPDVNTSCSSAAENDPSSPELHAAKPAVTVGEDGLRTMLRTASDNVRRYLQSEMSRVDRELGLLQDELGMVAKNVLRYVSGSYGPELQRKRRFDAQVFQDAVETTAQAVHDNVKAAKQHTKKRLKPLEKFVRGLVKNGKEAFKQRRDKRTRRRPRDEL